MVLSDRELQRCLMTGSAAVLAGDRDGVAAAETWLSGLTAAQLLRADCVARRWWGGEDPLGMSRQWTAEVLAGSAPTAAALASMHADGFVRERAVTRLTETAGPSADRALALRVTDHVPTIREAVIRAVLARTTQENAAHIMPVLELADGRRRSGDIRDRYVGRLIEEHGEAAVWSGLRQSPDRNVRRVAYRQSLAAGLLDVDAAVAALPTEPDQVVRRLLCQLIAERAAPEVVAGFLLRQGTAEGRALGLVRLRADQVDATVLQALLVDSSVFVRTLAVTRWTEQGHEALGFYRSTARDACLSPRVRARAYTGVSEVGGTIDRTESLTLVCSGHPPLVKAGLGQLADTATAEDVAVLFDVLRTGSSKEAKLAAAALLRLRRFWTGDDLAPMKESPDGVLRHRAWWLQRGLGGWEETLADLEILLDPVAEQRRCGRMVRPPMYAKPTESQQQRLRRLLPLVELPRARLLELAFAAGIRDALPSDNDCQRPSATFSGWAVSARQWLSASVSAGRRRSLREGINRPLRRSVGTVERRDDGGPGS